MVLSLSFQLSSHHLAYEIEMLAPSPATSGKAAPLSKRDPTQWRALGTLDPESRQSGWACGIEARSFPL